MRRQRNSGPALGSRRTRSGFLFFPKTIGGEERWFERAEWVEELRRVRRVAMDVGEYDTRLWIPIRWLP